MFWLLELKHTSLVPGEIDASTRKRPPLPWLYMSGSILCHFAFFHLRHREFSKSRKKSARHQPSNTHFSSLCFCVTAALMGKQLSTYNLCVQVKFSQYIVYIRNRLPRQKQKATKIARQQRADTQPPIVPVLRHLQLFFVLVRNHRNNENWAQQIYKILALISPLLSLCETRRLLAETKQT